MRRQSQANRSGSDHILVVDDEPAIADALTEFLVRSENYRVTKARNGQEAMAILESSAADPEGAIDLVLLDMRMPVISGPEVLTWLRNRPDLQYTRVIVLTAAAGNREKVEALSAGANDYITKPYYPHELLARVRNMLRSRHLERQLQRQSDQLATLNQVGRAVTASLAINDVLEAAVKGVDAVFGVERAAIFMTTSEQRSLRCRAVFPPDEDVPLDTVPPIPAGEGVVGHVFEKKTSLCLNEVRVDSVYRPGLDAPADFPTRSLLAAPLIVRGRPVGALSAINKRDGPFSEVDKDLFYSLSSSVSRAIEVAWLFQNVVLRQEELLESRNALQAVIDGILHPIYTIDEEWRVVAVNQTKANELRMPASELAGKRCYRVFFERNAPCDHCEVASILAGRGVGSWSIRWRGQDHLPQEWDVNAYPVPGSKAGSARAVVVWQNRTEERQLEASLMQAGKLAAIGQLAAGVAHEINNPLTAINANAAMLQMALGADDDNYESVDLIAQAGERAGNVVRGLLDFARQAEYEFEDVDVNRSIKQSLSLVSYQVNSAGIKVVTQLADPLATIKASSEHLQSVWVNLLINARDALQHVKGERRLEIITRPDEARPYVQVIVRDTGRGMTPAEMEHIFEPFYTTKAPGEGTGLGLANCLRIIQQHGGEINVASTPGDGSTFVISLPADGVALNLAGERRARVLSAAPTTSLPRT